MEVADGLLNLFCLIPLGEGFDEHHVLPFLIIGPELLLQLVLILLDDGVGQLQNRLRGAVVLLQPHHRGVRIVALKRQDVADVRPAEGVDALRIIAHHADVFMPRREELSQLVLGVVGILVLIDVEVPPAPLVFFEDVRMRLEQLDGFDEEVIEVQGVGPAQRLHVRPIQLRRSLLGCARRHALVVFRRHQLVLRAGDERPHGAHLKLLRVDVHPLHQVAQQAIRVIGVVNAEVRCVADVLTLAPQQARKGRVEGAHPHTPGASAADDLLHPLLHLAGRLVGERQRHHIARLGFGPGNKIRNAVGECARLARPRPGNNHDRAVGRLHRGLLRFIQPLEDLTGALVIGCGRRFVAAEFVLTHKLVFLRG